jgi:hypothetical protein
MVGRRPCWGTVGEVTRLFPRSDRATIAPKGVFQLGSAKISIEPDAGVLKDLLKRELASRVPERCGLAFST